MAAFGKYWNTIYRFDRASVIVSLDADFLCADHAGKSALHARLHRPPPRRRGKFVGAKPPRLYVAESAPSITGGMADHRFRMRAAEVEAFADALASAGTLAARANAAVAARTWSSIAARAS